MIITSEIGNGNLDDLIKRVLAGDEVLLTRNDQPVAKIVSAAKEKASPGTRLNIRSFKGHTVLTPVISQGDLAEEMFARQ